MAIEVFAPAKINLTLHVVGQRADGYHLLDSLVAFVDAGDKISTAKSAELTLHITGPMAGGLSVGEDNLVLRAARLMSVDGAEIILTKNLPIASGIGGGSTDAAATIRALSRLYDLPLPDPESTLVLGADVPVCLMGHSCRMSGVGETLVRLRQLPQAWLVLVNPGIGVATKAVFRALANKSGPAMPHDLPKWADVNDFARFLSVQRNDLEATAQTIEPAIGRVLDALRATANCLLARMSGSGSTSFGLYSSADDAYSAAARLEKAQPGWWIRSAKIL